MSHFDSLKKLIPLDLGAMADEDLKIEGQIFDQAEVAIQTILIEISPATAVQTLPRWEGEYAVGSKGDTTARRNAVVARMRELAASSDGSLRRDIWVAIADALGYEIELIESPAMFRAGISKAGDRVYSTSVLFVLTVVVLGESGADDLEELFNDLMPPYLKLEFDYV